MASLAISIAVTTQEESCTKMGLLKRGEIGGVRVHVQASINTTPFSVVDRLEPVR